MEVVRQQMFRFEIREKTLTDTEKNIYALNSKDIGNKFNQYASLIVYRTKSETIGNSSKFKRNIVVMKSQEHIEPQRTCSRLFRNELKGCCIYYTYET